MNVRKCTINKVRTVLNVTLSALNVITYQEIALNANLSIHFCMKMENVGNNVYKTAI